jgi:hypothetical protein
MSKTWWTPSNGRPHVRYCRLPKTDMGACTAHVCFWGVKLTLYHNVRPAFHHYSQNLQGGKPRL